MWNAYWVIFSRCRTQHAERIFSTCLTTCKKDILAVQARSNLPDGIQIQIPSSLGATHAPALSLVSPKPPIERAPPRPAKIQCVLSLGILPPIGRIRGRFELGNPLRLQSSFLGIGRVGNGLQTRDTRAAGAGRGRGGRDRRRGEGGGVGIAA
jgi:hypothetical protein